MEGIGDKTSISGASFLLNTKDIASDEAKAKFDPQAIEKQITSGGPDKPAQNFTQNYTQKIEKLSEEYENNKFRGYKSHKADHHKATSMMRKLDMMESNSEDSYSGSDSSGYDSSSNGSESGSDSSMESYGLGKDPIGVSRGGYNHGNHRSSRQHRRDSYADNIQDRRLRDMTHEEKRQKTINQAFEGMNNSSDTILNIEHERVEEEKARKLEEISHLLEILEEEGENITRIPKVDHADSLEDIEAVLKHLIFKNDRKRYGSFASEAILSASHGVEWLFDGQKKYFGCSPDMRGWSSSVKTKLRRMRHDTSTVVGQFMTKHSMGSGTRIFLELVPNAFLYSRLRRSQHRDNIINDDEYNAGLDDIRDNYE